jgi:sugar phosphate isomerase/epimerase
MDLDIPALIRQFGKCLHGLHISDSTGVFHDLHLTPGKGDLDWAAIIRALRDVKYDSNFHLELPHERADNLPETRRATEEAYQVCQRLLSV